MVEQNETVSILVQLRPPEDDELIKAGEFDWESFQPEGAWAGRYLVVPRLAKVPRDEALPSCFYALPIGTNTELNFLAEPLTQWVRPQLLYMRNTDSESCSIRVFVDGEQFHEGSLRARQGTIELPELPVTQWQSASQLRVETDQDTVVMVNYCHAPNLDSYLKRTALRVRQRKLKFEIEKTDAEELLSIKLYRPLPQDSRVHLRAELEFHRPDGSEPMEARTITRRLFDIAPVTEHSQRTAWVLGTRGEITGDGMSCFIRLGTDLPAGKYRITLRAEDFDDGYVMLYRVRPGRAPTRELKFEPRPVLSDVVSLAPLAAVIGATP